MTRQEHHALIEARDKAAKLLAELEAQQRELKAAPPQLPPPSLAKGVRAIDNAIESAQGMLRSLEAAIDLVGRDGGRPREQGSHHDRH